jgi:hypothetical protein
VAIKLCFAYGSNLLDAEIKRDAPHAYFRGTAYVSDYALVFNKHTRTESYVNLPTALRGANV